MTNALKSRNLSLAAASRRGRIDGGVPDSVAMERLKKAADKALLELSSVQETSINLPFITADATGPKHFETQLTRAEPKGWYRGK